MTKLKALNLFVLQWFGFRLARITHGEKTLGYTWIGPVLPLSGWNCDYIWLWKRKP